MTYKEMEEVSARYAKMVVQHLTNLSEKLPREIDVEPALPIWPKETLEPFYRSHMMRSLLQLVTVEPPTE